MANKVKRKTKEKSKIIKDSVVENKVEKKQPIPKSKEIIKEEVIDLKKEHKVAQSKKKKSIVNPYNYAITMFIEGKSITILPHKEVTL